MFQSYDAQTNPEPAKKSILPTCLFSCLILFIIMLIGGAIGGWVLWKKGPALAAKAVGSAMKDGIQKSDMSDEEKTKVIEQIDRLQGAVERGEVGLGDVERVVKRFSESPLMGIAMVQLMQQKYLTPSGLQPEEKVEGARIIQRIARGFYEKSVTFEQLEGPMSLIGNKDTQGNWSLKDSVDDNTLRQFLGECKTIADAASIPDEEFAVSIGDELKKFVDDVLSGSTE